MKRLFTEEQVQIAIKSLASGIDEKFCKDYSVDYLSSKEVVFIGILKGGIDFMFKLLKNVNIRYTFGFLSISSYGSGHRPGQPKLEYVGIPDLKDKDVVIVDDIVDTGNSIELAKKITMLYEPASLTTVTLLLRENTPKDPDMFGLIVGNDRFVIGSGMGNGDLYRYMKGIWIM